MTALVADNCVLVHDARRRRWRLYRDPIEVRTTGRLERVVPMLRDLEARVAKERFHAAGFLAYEAAPAFDPALKVRADDTFPLLWFGLYPAPEEIELPAARPEAGRVDWAPSISVETYRAAVARIKDYIRTGDTYQVNYSFRLRSQLEQNPNELFLQMIAAQGPGYGAFVNAGDWIVCCASPELCFQLAGRDLVCRPMKGTAARGLRLGDDLARSAGLQRSAKDRAENVMIVDMVRNDLGRIADWGSVQVTSLFDVEKYPTLWQLTSTVRAATSAGVTEILHALFPAASITGAPKARTMEIIAGLETAPRRTYTGSIGFIAPDREAQFNVAIRTVLVDRRTRTAEYGVGGGIVWESVAAAEHAECRTKAAIITRSRPDFSLLETLRWTPEEGSFLLDGHLRRLRESADYFSFPLDLERIRRDLERFTQTFPPRPQRVRLLVTRTGEPSLATQDLDPTPADIRVCLAKQPVDVSDPFLYHKTTHRRVYDDARVACPGFADVLLWNERGEMTESCFANLVVELDGEQITPPVECGLLPGVYRAHLLATRQAREGIVRREDLARCPRIWLVNSVRTKSLRVLGKVI
jgi:para-aminobenzoate synthetase / 4-amino-4-deoxychorismate lyase